MSVRGIRGFAVTAALALLLAACGGGDEAVVEVEEDAKFPAGTTMAKLNEAQSVKIGTKIDQPGLGFKKAGADAPEGFDVEMAKIVAAKLGIPVDKIEWVETVSDNREPFLDNGTVDLVFASYSITDERRQVVGQAGPYYVTGQQLLVRKDDDSITGPDDLDGKKVCSVEGSTSIKTVEEEYGASPVPFATYSECVQQLLSESVDAVTTDGAILLGYAAQNEGELKVVGEEFSKERIGVGFSKKHPEMCEWINGVLTESCEDGSWAEAFEATLGGDYVETPEPPALDDCPAA